VAEDLCNKPEQTHEDVHDGFPGRSQRGWDAIEASYPLSARSSRLPNPYRNIHRDDGAPRRINNSQEGDRIAWAIGTSLRLITPSTRPATGINIVVNIPKDATIRFRRAVSAPRGWFAVVLNLFSMPKQEEISQGLRLQPGLRARIAVRDRQVGYSSGGPSVCDFQEEQSAASTRRVLMNCCQDRSVNGVIGYAGGRARMY